MEVYALGHGQDDLGRRLDIKNCSSLAIGGSANSRIIRTTLKHSYQTKFPTFYILGMTFLSRNEIPILNPDNEFEGSWTNPQNQQFSNRWQQHWTQKDTDLYVELKLKAEWSSISDRLEDLMYRILSMGSDLQSRGHRVLVFQQADDIYQQFLTESKFNLFKETTWIVDGYKWCSIPWQHSKGVPLSKSSLSTVPKNICHRHPQHYSVLNSFLEDYIKQNQILT
jgi:hypothetical protein